MDKPWKRSHIIRRSLSTRPTWWQATGGYIRRRPRSASRPSESSAWPSRPPASSRRNAKPWSGRAPGDGAIAGARASRGALPVSGATSAGAKAPITGKRGWNAGWVWGSSPRTYAASPWRSKSNLPSEESSSILSPFACHEPPSQAYLSISQWILVLLCITVLTSSLAVSRSAVMAATVFYIVGAMTGLFGQLYRESIGSIWVNDYGLSFTRLFATPL